MGLSLEGRFRTTRGVLTRRTSTAVGVFIASLVLVEASEHFPTRLSPTGRALAVTIWIAAAIWVYHTPCAACRKALRWEAFRWAFASRYGQRSPKCPHCGVSIDHSEPSIRKR